MAVQGNGTSATGDPGSPRYARDDENRGGTNQIIRPGQDSDAPAFIALIERCWSDYENCRLYVDADEPDLRALASYYAATGGALWIANEGKGMIATRPAIDLIWEICRVYVMPNYHGTGLANVLLHTAERYALDRGALEFELWTDTRFTRAHRFYEKNGYRRQSQQRTLHDTNGPFAEFRYWKAVQA